MSINEKIPWDDRYALGIEMIDTQHKQLFTLVNKLYDLEDHKSTKDELKTILYEFSNYMGTHFKDEEDYMSSIDYPGLEDHKQIHQGLIDHLTTVIKTPATLAIMKTKMRVIAKRALLDHIIHEDVNIKLFEMSKENDKLIFDITDIETDS